MIDHRAGTVGGRSAASTQRTDRPGADPRPGHGSDPCLSRSDLVGDLTGDTAAGGQPASGNTDVSGGQPASGNGDTGVSGGQTGAVREALGAAAPLPLPAGGATWERMQGLARMAGRDLILGRLYEGHTDALAILAEAGRNRRPGALYGVWAARSTRRPTTASPTSTGWRLAGTKEFCSGIGIIDRALISAEAPDGYRLFDVDLSGGGLTVDADSWPAVGMAGSVSLTLELDAVAVDADDAVGPAGFYTSRPGFWFGAAGVAACWYGGAAALVERLVQSLPAAPSDLVLAELGRAVARVAGMRDCLRRVADEIDADPTDSSGRGRYRALAVRETVHEACVAVLALVAEAGGARPLGHDASQARRAADLYVYLSQHHGAVDAAALGRLALDGGQRTC